jgi:hypothetical protein
MKNIPKSIFLQIIGDEKRDNSDDFNQFAKSEITWSEERIYASDYEFVLRLKSKELICKTSNRGNDNIP